MIASFLGCTAYSLVSALLSKLFVLEDASGLGGFVTAFGTIYGIVVGFIVIEVWSQKKDIQKLLEKEAQDIEGLYFLVHYFNDAVLKRKLRTKLAKYTNIVLKIETGSLPTKERYQKIDEIFREISTLFDTIEFDEDQDPIIFEQMISQLKELKDTRTERIRESMIRLPAPLQFFIWVSSAFIILTVILLPFDSNLLHLFSISSITFFISYILQIISDLDNPFVGYWNVDFSSLREVKQKVKRGE